LPRTAAVTPQHIVRRAAATPPSSVMHSRSVTVSRRRPQSCMQDNAAAPLPSFNRFAVCISSTASVHPPSMKSTAVMPSSKVI